MAKAIKHLLSIAFLGFLALSIVKSTDSTAFPVDDFVEYWSASRLLLTHRNPYSSEEMLSIQRTAGWLESEPLMMWNPPWSLTLLIPFGFLKYSLGRLVWLLLNLGLIVVASDCLWRIYGGALRLRLVAWLLGFSFLPSLVALSIGQISPIVLVGITGFFTS